MTTGGASAWGIRSLADSFLRYFQPSLPCYLRMQYIPMIDASGNIQAFSELGFMPAVTGGGPQGGGYQDLLVDPPPDVQEVSMHNIGIMGGRLQFGARTFVVSDTFVTNQMALRGLADPYQVWRDELVMGLFYNGRMFSIESITHEDVGGETTLWKLVCNSNEFQAPPLNAT